MMAITFPRHLPAGRLLECSFDLVDPIATSTSSSGLKLNQMQFADPVWRATIATGNLDRTGRAAWRAWRKSLRGGLSRFLAYDFARRAPLAHWGATSAADILRGWDGTATVEGLGAAGALMLSGLPERYIISADDPIGLVENGVYGYFSALETVPAVAGAATVQVAPFEHFPAFTNDVASAVLWRPLAMFSIDWNSWNLPEIDGLAPARFTATQRLL